MDREKEREKEHCMESEKIKVVLVSSMKCRAFCYKNLLEKFLNIAKVELTLSMWLVL